MVTPVTTREIARGANGFAEAITDLPAFAPAEPISDPVASPAIPRPLYCRRCDSRMMMGYDEPQCLNCGYADYSYTRTTIPQSERNVISSATRYILRYVGDFHTLTETLTHVRVVRVRNRVDYAVNCPFCLKGMDQSSLSGKRPEVREQRFKCSDGHRVSLVPGKHGMLGWR